MKKTDKQILFILMAFDRLAQLDISNKARYAIARNVQVLEPLRAATLKAFPPPKPPGDLKEPPTIEAAEEFRKQEAAWLDSLPTEEREFTAFMFTEIPEFKDEGKQEQAIINTLVDFIHG